MLIRVLLYIFIFYVAITAFAYYFADSYIFVPPQSSYQDTTRILKIPTQNGSLISAIYLPNEKATYTVLVSHGNATDLGYLQPFLEKFHEQGFAIFAYDYEGYGTSQGKPTEKNAYSDINAAYRYLTEQLKIPAKHIILYGHSLGAAVAIDLAAREPVAGVIAESPFLTAFRVVIRVPFFPFEKFDNVSKIKNIKSPILIIHGNKDATIPFWQGKKLFEMAPSPKVFLEIENAGHSDVEVVDGDNYWPAIRAMGIQ